MFGAGSRVMDGGGPGGWKCFGSVYIPNPCTLRNPGTSSCSPLDREIQGSSRGGEVGVATPLQ